MRAFAIVALCIVATVPTSSWALPPTVGLISQIEARRHGLQRAWLTQVSLDPARDRVANVMLDGPHLIVQTDKSLIQVLDAQTGGKIWTAQVGKRDYPASPAAANENLIAVVNGSTLYLLDRATGKTLRQERLRGVPSGHVALGKAWVYVPSLNGQVAVYGLEDPKASWNCYSHGFIDMPPLKAESALVWGTSKGHVYFASPSDGSINFRLQTNGPVAAPMGYWPPLVLAASRDGYLYAVHERSGETMWRFSLGTAVNEAPAVINASVYVVAEAGGMHCLAVEDGSTRWFSPKAMRLLAVSQQYVYAVDRFGNTLVLDVNTGGHLDTLETWQLPIKYTNLQNDRLYLGNPTGLLMCLHELALKEPIQHTLPDARIKLPPPTDDTPADPAAQSDAVNPQQP
jgi:outer membrane protein assembly factor BamB